MNVQAVRRLKQAAADVGDPIAYVSEPTKTTVRIVFADGTVELSENAALQRVLRHKPLEG